MSNFKTIEADHTTPDGAKLYTKTWKPLGPVLARVVFIHGFSDHCNAYGILFPSLATRGIEVLTFDQRGWGRSVTKPTEKGLTGTTARVLEDITSFMRRLIPSLVPLFLAGHSMGGGEVLTYAARGPSDVRKHIRGYLCEAPFIGFHPAAKPSRITVTLGRLAGKVLPKRQMLQKLDASLLCRDPEVGKAWIEDELCHDTGTLEGLAGLLDRANGLDDGKIVVGDAAGEGGVTRMWIAHGTDDGVCSFNATKRWFEREKAKDKTLKVYDGWFHKLHDEPGEDKMTFAKDFADWVLAKSDKLELGGREGQEKSKL